MGSGHTRGTAADKAEEGAGHGRSVCPESPGPHATFNGGDSGLPPRKGELIPKPHLSWDRGLQLALVNAESLVTARYHRAVNTSPLLAHTARRCTRAGDWTRARLVGGFESSSGEEAEVVTRWPHGNVWPDHLPYSLRLGLAVGWVWRWLGLWFYSSF